MSQSQSDTASSRQFGDVLGSILGSASIMFPAVEGFDIRFSVALVGEMGKDEFANLLGEMPVIADIGISEDLGEKAAILTDIPTASALAGLVSTGEPTEKDTLSEDDIASLGDALNPILEAFSAACREATGRPFGSIESIEISDPVSQERMVEELPESLCRATAWVSIGQEVNGRIALVVPLNLAEVMAEADTTAPKCEVRSYEPVEIEEDTSARPEAGAMREPSMENIDLILDIQLELTARLGQVEMPIGEIMKLAPGSVIDIDRFADEPIELVVNDRPIARGEIVVVQEIFGIRITEIISPKERIKSLR
jgi:flagellar motor switch protein FliN/FliY